MEDKYFLEGIRLGGSTTEEVPKFLLGLVWMHVYIHFNPHVLEWIGMELSLIPLQCTSTYVGQDEYMCIQTRPYDACCILVVGPRTCRYIVMGLHVS